MESTQLTGFPYYIALIGESDVKALFESAEHYKFFSSLSEEQGNYSYALNKWSIKEVIGHIIDHERIMMYRALRFSRQDNTPLPGYDQDLLVRNSSNKERSIKDLVQEYYNVRQASLSLINSFTAEQLQEKGMAWKYELSVEDVLKATIGHEIHHVVVIRKRYLDYK